MPDYTIFKNNKFKSVISVPDFDTLELNLEEGDQYIEGYYSDEVYYIKNNEFHPYPEKPNYPHIFNLETEEWDWNEQASWDDLRYNRDQKLILELDPVVSNPLRWNSLTSEKQTEYTNYRQALLDLPQNTTDPRNPVWPEPPQ